MSGGLASDTVIVLLTMTMAGLVVGWIGYRIRYRGDIHLIAGVRRSSVTDDSALARVAGRTTLAVAAVTVVAGLLYPVVQHGSIDQLSYWGGYAAVVLTLGGYSWLARRPYVSAR